MSYDASSSPDDSAKGSELRLAAACDIGLGEMARARGVVIDLDHEATQAAMMQGHMTEEQCWQYPVIIGSTDRPHHKALFRSHSPGNYGRPAVHVFAYKGVGEVSTRAVAHEAAHLSDYVRWGSEAFTAPRVRRLRKVGAGLGSLIIDTPAVFLFAKAQGLTIGMAIESLVYGDIMLSVMLAIEYVTRREEKRAERAAQQVDHANILVVENQKQAVTPGSTELRRGKQKKIFHLAKQILVPNFKY